MGASRREHNRVSTGISVKVKTSNGQLTTTERLLNLSLGGVFIEMPDPLPFGTDVDLEFNLPAHGGAVRCRGYVAWTTREAPERGEGHVGIGVRLMEIGVREMRLVNDFIERELRAKG